MKSLSQKVWLSSPTMHGEELQYMNEAYTTNWMSTIGKNIDVIEKDIAELLGVNNAVALSSGTAALHLAMKLAGERLYGKPSQGQGALQKKHVFCSDLTFSATVNPIVYEGGIPVFIDSEADTWNMDPVALEKAFELYPETKLVVLVHLYGFPAQVEEIQQICQKHGALLIEDAAESMGATVHGVQTGAFGDYSIISFNGNKIITGSSGGMLFSSDSQEINKARKWSTQSRENAPWYQHEELGYNYRMSNVIAGVVRGQLPYLKEHIAQKKAIFERYKEKLGDLPVTFNPFHEDVVVPNYWLSCLLIDADHLAQHVRSDSDYLYVSEPSKTSPSEILDVLQSINAEGRPIWKPMHDQPYFRMNSFVTIQGQARASSNAYIPGSVTSIASDLFHRGLCLPSDNKMTEKEQDIIIEAIRFCFS